MLLPTPSPPPLLLPPSSGKDLKEEGKKSRVVQAGDWETAVEKYRASQEESAAKEAQAVMLENRAMSLAEGASMAIS